MKSITINGMLKLIITIILVQTLYFKLKANAESVYIFSEMQLEPYDRIGTAILELLATALLFFRKTRLLGAFLVMFIMLMAILIHIFIIGIEILNDSGVMFALAVLTFICSTVLVYRFRKDCTFIGKHNR